MTETDVSDATFYSAIDQISGRPSRREGTYEARKKAEVIAFASDSGVPVNNAVKTTPVLKIASRNGKSVGAKKTQSMPGELKATRLPGEDNAKRLALQRLVQERANRMAAHNSRKN